MEAFVDVVWVQRGGSVRFTQLSGNGFLGDYYEHLAEEDAQVYSPDLLVARAQTHREVAAVRVPGTANIAIADEADRSVVYIVTDDMPFLVDSVNAELVRQNCAIRLGHAPACLWSPATGNPRS